MIVHHFLCTFHFKPTAITGPTGPCIQFRVVVTVLSVVVTVLWVVVTILCTFPYNFAFRTWINACVRVEAAEEDIPCVVLELFITCSDTTTDVRASRLESPRPALTTSLHFNLGW